MKNPNGFGSVIKLSGKRRRPYAAVVTLGFDDNGKQKRKFIGYSNNYKGAMQILIEYSDNPHLYLNNLTVKQVYDKWSNMHYETIGDGAISSYKVAWNKCKSIMNMKIKDIRLPDLQSIVDSCGDLYAAKKQLKMLLNQVYRYAMKNEYILKDYSQYIDVGKSEIKIVRIPFSNEEIETLWQNIDKLKGIDTLLILIYTGFRIGELLDLKCGNINLEENYMIGGKKTEAGKDRLVPIHPKIKKLIENRMGNRPEDRYFIETIKLKQMRYDNYRMCIFEPIMTKLNMTHRIHDTRHTFATLLSNMDVNPTSIKKLIGHSSYSMTEKVYTHKNIEELRKAIEKI